MTEFAKPCTYSTCLRDTPCFRDDCPLRPDRSDRARFHPDAHCKHGHPLNSATPCPKCSEGFASPEIPPPIPGGDCDSDYLAKEPRRLLTPMDSATRKTHPMCAGLLDYFPDALAAVAEISYNGNQKHNPGQPMHWARGKSMDHADCIARHLVERGGKDPEGNRHSAQLAWRALALLQEELEAAFLLDWPRSAR